MHPPVPDGVDGAALETSRRAGASVGGGVLGEHEAVTVSTRLGHHEQRQAPVGLGAVGIGAGQQHQHVGARGEGAPRLDPVDGPATVPARRGHLDAGDVRAEVRLGHRDRGHHLAAGQPRQPVLLLLLGASLDEGAREDLGSGDKRAPGSERSAGQLFGGDDHPHVLALAAGREPAVLLGHTQPKGADLGQSGDDVLGNVGVVAVHVLGHRLHLLLGEAAEGVLHHLEVAVQMAWALLAGQRRQELGGAKGAHEVVRGGQGVRLDAPLLLAAEGAGDDVEDGVGREGAGQDGLDLTPGAVVERGPGTLDRRGGVCQVVGEDLVLVGPADGRQVPGGGVDGDRGLLDDDGCGVEIGGDHAAQVRGGEPAASTEPPGEPAR